jgi:hypothetical protein
MIVVVIILIVVFFLIVCNSYEESKYNQKWLNDKIKHDLKQKKDEENISH